MTTPPDPSSDDAGRRVASVERAADVLFLFTDDDRSSLGITEIAGELGIAKAVVHRILTSLRERDLVMADPVTRRYSLGPGVLGLAASYHRQLDVRPLALEAMQRLSQATGETSTLSIRNGFHRIYVDQVTPPIEVCMTVQTGRPYPLHAGSSSKAFLAFLPPDEQARCLDERPLDALTDATITDPDALRDELADIRRRGFASSVGERQVGAASIAAPVFDQHGPVAVVSVCGPLERMRDRVDEIAPMLIAETAALSQRLGAVPSGTPAR